MFRLLVFVLLFLGFPSPASAQFIGTCPDEKEIKANANGWRDSQREFQKVPPEVPAFYDPYLNNNFPKNTHLDTSMLPDKDSLACLIAFAKQEWHDLYGTKFDDKNVEKVINFALNNNYNPSLLLALWAEETHGGDMSDIQLGCGAAYGLDAQLKCLAGINPKYKLNSFACFLGSYAADTPLSLNCGYGDPDGIVTNPVFIYVIQYYKYLTSGVIPGQIPSPPITTTDFKVHPLRPNPDDPISADTPLTTYCAMRPLPVGQNKIDMRVPYADAPIVDVFTVGNLTQDFREFITPLLSITNPKKADYSLPFNQKAQRYLLDFLEGRAYYEPFAEPTNPTPTQTQDLFNRLGVFRKLAPKTYQDELKRAIIQRAAGTFNASDNPYGFDPASATIHNYTVGSWQGAAVTLKDFVNNWAPLPKDFYPLYAQSAYEVAYQSWKNQDGGKWYNLWPYVPMFTREDTTGIIEIVDSNPPPDPYSPTGQWIEKNESSKDTVDVSHPHLARAYEVSTSLSYLLTPQEVHESAQTPELADSWIPSQWGSNSTWLDPSYKRPPYAQYGIELGAHCDVNPIVINPISSSGDLALDDQFTTKVKRVDIGLTHAMINGEESVEGSASPEDKKNCGAQYDCETCVLDYTDPITGVDYYHLDDVGCFYYKQIRSNPNYLISYTPFLNEILTSLSGGQRGLFDLFKPAGLPKQPYEEFDWPGVGNAGEESPKYGYTPTGGYKSKTTVEEKGWAEAGARKPGDSQSYYYRYLGSIQCAKERVMMTLQPFITGEAYKPFAGDCFKPKGEPGPAEQIQPTGATCTTEKIPLEFPNDSNSPIAQRAWEIVSDLYQGFWCYWNRSPGDFASDVTDYPPSYPELFDEDLYAQIPNPTPEQLSQQYFNMFWCTWLVTKAFNEAGHSMPSDLLYTPDMVAWFQSQGKYLEAGSVTYKNVAPGDAVFFRIPPDYYRLNHVAIVYSVTQDGITTVESNAGYKTMFYPTDTNGHFQEVSGIKIEGFGKP